MCLHRSVLLYIVMFVVRKTRLRETPREYLVTVSYIYIYIYIYTHTHTCVCVCVCVYVWFPKTEVSRQFCSAINFTAESSPNKKYAPCIVMSYEAIRANFPIDLVTDFPFNAYILMKQIHKLDVVRGEYIWASRPNHMLA